MRQWLSGFASGLSQGAARRRRREQRRRQSRRAMGSVAIVQTCESLEDRVLLAGVDTGDILVSDNGLDAVVIVDPTSGDREILSGNPTGADVGTGPDLSIPLGIDYVSRANILVIDNGVDGLFRIDGTFGNREIISIGPVAAGLAGVAAVGTGVEFVTPIGVSVDAAAEFAYITDRSLDAVVRVDLRAGATFGDRLIVSDDTTPDGTNPFDIPSGTAFDATGRLLVADQSPDQLLRVDDLTPALGARTVVSNNTTPDGTNPFSSPVDIAVESNGDLLVVDLDNDTLFRVDPLTGARTILSNATTPDGTNPLQLPVSVKLEADGDIIVKDLTESVFRVDPTTGARTLLSGGAAGAGPAFSSFVFGMDIVLDDHANVATGATPVALPSTTDGVIEVDGDVDFFQVSLLDGSTYKFETILNTLSDTILTLFDTDGTTQLDFDDNGGAGQASLIQFTAALDGDYFLQVAGVGSLTGSYMLDVLEFPDDHANGPLGATPVAVPSTTGGVINFVGDPDFFGVQVFGGADYTFEALLDTLNNSTLTLFDTDGVTLLEFDDDGGTGFGSLINWTAPVDGTYFLEVAGVGTGSYMLDVSSNTLGAPLIIDDGDPGFSTIGAWGMASNASARDGDLHSRAPGKGGSSAQWEFTGLTPGNYRVAATWVEHANRANNSPFTFREAANGNGLNSVTVNQKLAPNDFNSDGTDWENVAVVTITGSTLVVELRNGANGFVIADAIRITPVTDPAPVVASIIDDGEAGFATTGDWNITAVANGRDGDLRNSVRGDGSDKATWTFTGLTPGNYLVSATWFAHDNRATNAPFHIFDGTGVDADTQGAPSPLGVLGGTLLETVLVDQEQFPDDFSDRGSDWERLAVVTITGTELVVELTDDANGFVIADAIHIEPTTDSPHTIIDNGDAGFTNTVGWTSPALPSGHEGDVLNAIKGDGSSIATWTFDGLTPGMYTVSATWTSHANRATDAPYTIFDGAAPLVTIDINQELAPDDRTSFGSDWEDLGIFTITGNTLVVELSNDANEYVIADAVRIEPVV